MRAVESGGAGPGELLATLTEIFDDARGGAARVEPSKMEATLGPVYTAQQMAAGAAGCAIVKVSPGA